MVDANGYSPDSIGCPQPSTRTSLVIMARSSWTVLTAVSALVALVQILQPLEL